MRFAFAILGFALAASAASGATFSYAGTALSPAVGGGTGAKAITLSFTAAQAPKPGKCVLATKLAKYSDGARTWNKLRKAGYKLIRNGDTGPVTYARVCLGTNGTTVSGTYNILAEYYNGVVLDDFIANNISNGNATDRVEFDEYLGGDPHIYSDVSASPGIWLITP